MALDLRDVVRAADAELVVLAAKGAGDALGDGGLAGARRADEAENLAGDVALQLAHGDELEDAVLDVLQGVSRCVVCVMSDVMGDVM